MSHAPDGFMQTAVFLSSAPSSPTLVQGGGALPAKLQAGRGSRPHPVLRPLQPLAC